MAALVRHNLALGQYQFIMPFSHFSFMPMPKASHHHALARQWELLRLLPTRGHGITAADLASRLQDRGFIVSKRTIERDLTELSTLFGIVCNDKGMPYGWYWMNGEPADLPGLSITDAVSLNLIEEFLRPLVPSAMLETLEARFKQAKKKLAELADVNLAARWVEKVKYVSPSLNLIPPKIHGGVLEAVQEGLLAERQIKVRYNKPSSLQVHELILHPLGLAQRGSVSYLVATAYDYSDIRLYAIHRIEEVILLDDPIVRPDHFSLEDYISGGALQFGSGVPIDLKARVSKSLAAILEETPLSAGQTLSPDGENFLLSATVLDSWQLGWWILSQGSNIEVVEPWQLRQKTIERLTTALSRYSK